MKQSPITTIISCTTLIITCIAQQQILHAAAPATTSTDRNRELFSCIFKTNAWLDPNTKSGSGSNLQQTTIIRKILPEVFRQLSIKSLLDVPCGDFYWMKETDLSSLEIYIGADIVPEIIKSNKEKFATNKRSFRQLDIITQALPKADAILCRDCLPHLTNAEIKTAINNIKKSGATFLITSTYPERYENQDLTISQLSHLWRYRPINFQLAPFNFPPPLVIINEGNTENNGSISDKSLGIWRVADLPDFE